jgi:hypothetical protein
MSEDPYAEITELKEILQSESDARSADAAIIAALRDEIHDRAQVEADLRARAEAAEAKNAALQELADQWQDMLRTESLVMTTPQKNAWAFALRELRSALAQVGEESGGDADGVYCQEQSALIDGVIWYCVLTRGHEQYHRSLDGRTWPLHGGDAEPGGEQ